MEGPLEVLGLVPKLTNDYAGGGFVWSQPSAAAVPSFLEGGLISGGFALVVAAAEIFVFLRFGLLALVFANIFGHTLQFPLTTDSSAWYAGTSLFALGFLAALAIYGFRIALAGRPAFSGTGLDD